MINRIYFMGGGGGRSSKNFFEAMLSWQMFDRFEFCSSILFTVNNFKMILTFVSLRGYKRAWTINKAIIVPKSIFQKIYFYSDHFVNAGRRANLSFQVLLNALFHGTRIYDNFFFSCFAVKVKNISICYPKR